MQMVTLNLMPDEKKHRIERLVQYLFLKYIIMVLTFFLCLSGIIFLISRYVLEKEFITLSENITYIPKETVEINKQIKNINSKIIAVSAAQDRFVPWSKVGVEIANATPSGFKWNLWEFVRDSDISGNIRITGTANSRDALFSLEANLKKIPWIKSIDIPLDSIVKIGTEPITFQLKFVPALVL